MSKKMSDFTVKVLALIIAIFLWSYVMSEANPEIAREYRNVTVNFSNVSALDRQGLVVMEPQEVSINVRVSGKKSDMDKFSAGNITAQVDLSGYSEGQVKIPVTVGLIDQSSGIRVVNHEPKEILFTLDRYITKNTPVTIQTTGALPDNYVLGDITSRTQSVILRGPRTWVNEVSAVIAIVSLNDKTDSTTVSVPIKLVDDKDQDVRGVDKEPNMVDIHIPVLRTVSLPIELQTTNELPENFNITDIVISPSTIVVKGNNSIVNLSKIETQLLDINSLLDKNAMEVELNLPEGVELLNPNERVTISYNIEETITKEFNLSVEELDILNLDENLAIKPEDLTNSILISLKGIRSRLDNLNNENLNASIDLQGLLEGRHEVEIFLNNIQGITVEEITPQPLIIDLITP